MRSVSDLTFKRTPFKLAIKIVLTIGLFTAFPHKVIYAASSPFCSELFRPVDVLADERSAVKTIQDASYDNALTTAKSLGKKARGFAVITAAMVASAALSTHLTAELPKDMAFLSHLVGQVSTIGIFVLGAPIWEPISSAFRKYAFGLGTTNPLTTSDPTLEKLWQRTQGQYSLNAQMSRNVIQSFLLAAQASFASAREAMNSGRESLAVDQLAEAAVRQRRLFSEIDPQDPSVALAIHATFTRHVSEPRKLEVPIMRQIEIGDPQAALSPSVRDYYQQLLKAWLE